MAPGQVLFDQAGLGRGKVEGRGIGKSAAVRGLERGTSFGEVHAPYLQATPAGPTRVSFSHVHLCDNKLGANACEQGDK
jgi:hypothetical protein